MRCVPDRQCSQHMHAGPEICGCGAHCFYAFIFVWVQQAPSWSGRRIEESGRQCRLNFVLPQVYRISFPAASGTTRSSAEEAQLGAAGSLMGLDPETFYQLFPFRECAGWGPWKCGTCAAPESASWVKLVVRARGSVGRMRCSETHLGPCVSVMYG